MGQRLSGAVQAAGSCTAVPQGALSAAVLRLAQLPLSPVPLSPPAPLSHPAPLTASLTLTAAFSSSVPFYSL